MYIRPYHFAALIALMLSSRLWAQGNGKSSFTLSMWGKAMVPFSSHRADRWSRSILARIWCLGIATSLNRIVTSWA